MDAHKIVTLIEKGETSKVIDKIACREVNYNNLQEAFNIIGRKIRNAKLDLAQKIEFWEKSVDNKLIKTISKNMIKELKEIEKILR